MRLAPPGLVFLLPGFLASGPLNPPPQTPPLLPHLYWSSLNKSKKMAREAMRRASFALSTTV